ncbi:MAG: hypothetical protein IKI68_01275 [Clostridia bacterium]|nr:hypothetical protein [Clostridia bacterium]
MAKNTHFYKLWLIIDKDKMVLEGKISVPLCLKAMKKRIATIGSRIQKSPGRSRGFLKTK